VEHAFHTIAAVIPGGNDSKGHAESDMVVAKTPDARGARPMVDEYRPIVAGFLSFDRHSKTKSRTVFADAGKASSRTGRQNSPKMSKIKSKTSQRKRMKSKRAAPKRLKKRR